MNKTAKWLMILLSATLLGAGVSALVTQYTYQNNGSIAAIGVSVTWMDGSPVETINWGPVESGVAYVWDEPLNVTNTSNVDATLGLSTIDLSGSIASLSLTWDYIDGTILAPKEWVIVELTQTVTASGDWSYTTVIAAKSVE